MGQTVSGYFALRDTPAHRPSQLSPVSVVTDNVYRTLPRAGLFPGARSWTFKDILRLALLLLVDCLTSQQQASVSQGRICSDNLTCCHTEIEVADPTFYLTQSQYTDTGPTSPSADPISPGAWQGSHRSANFLSHWYDSTPKKSRLQRDSNPGPSALEADALTTRPTRRLRFATRHTESCPCSPYLCLSQPALKQVRELSCCMVTVTVGGSREGCVPTAPASS